MSQSLVLNIKGLYTSYNSYSEAPSGSLIEAKNIEISQESIAEPRRGFDRDGGVLYTNSNARARGLFDYKGFGYALTQAPPGTNQTLQYQDNTGTWQFVTGNADPISGYKVHTAESNQNLYFSSATGIQKLEDTNSPTYAGAPKSLDFAIATDSATPAWLPNHFKVAYRTIWTRTDVNGNLLLGAPSQRYLITNTTGSTIATHAVVSLPVLDNTQVWTLQLYRSEMIDNTSVTTDPSDEMQLVAELSVTLNGSRGTATIIDTCTEAARGAFLYTSASQQGLAAQNNPPPYAVDLTPFNGSMFYSNIRTPSHYFLTLSFIGGTKGLALNDTVMIASPLGNLTLTAKSSETISNGEFKLSTGGTDLQNIIDTTNSIVRVINQANTSVVTAYLLSAPSDPPGQIYIENLYFFNSPAFTITVNRPSAWTPNNIPTSGTTSSSTTDTFVNGLYWSKSQQPDHVPLTNFVQVGSKNNEILRIITLRDALYIFKKKEGLYRLTGSYPNYTIDLLDASVKLIAPESAVVVDNNIYCLTDKGVCQIADSTVIISEPIRQELLQLALPSLTNTSNTAFGISYESEMKYYIFLPTSSTNNYCSIAYVFNLITSSWVTHEMDCFTGYVYTDKKLRLGVTNFPNVFVETKNYDFADYADFKLESSLTTISSRVLTIADNFDTLNIGDIVWQSASLFSTITSIDPVNTTFTVDSNPGFTIAAVSIYSPINTVVTWAPQALQNPGILKHFHTTTLLFKKGFIGVGELGYTTDLSKSEDLIPIEGASIGIWGLFPWGKASWGGELQDTTVRQWVPRNKQTASEITVSFKHSYGYSPWELLGISLFGNPAQEKVQK